MMMNTKTGKFILAGSAILCFLLLRKHYINMLEKFEYNQNLDQYLNRFIEFYDSSNLLEVNKRFFMLIDYGLDAEEAFNLLISKVNK